MDKGKCKRLYFLCFDWIILWNCQIRSYIKLIFPTRKIDIWQGEKLSLKEKVLFYQELTNNAWPAKGFFFLNGWIIRFSNGVFSRANSVLPLRYFGSDIKNDILRTEKIYSKKKLNVIFQIPDYKRPLNLDEVLETEGYNVKSPTTVMILKTKTQEVLEIPDNYHFSVISSDIEVQWLKNIKLFLNQSAKRTQFQEAVIRRIMIPNKFFYFIKSDTNTVGITLGVHERGNLGIYSFVVDPKLRKKGIGTLFMSYIIKWCQKNSIKTIYLQVEKENHPALNLYKKIGFQTIYDYHYRIKDTE
jgi:GNAT superfamily N-acetyltransferase